MKCRNWRTEDPERPENPEEPEEPENPEDPERSGISGSLRKRPVRATPENPESFGNSKRKQPRTQIYAFCPKTTGSAPIYLPCHRAFTHEMPHAPALRTAKTHPPRAVNPYPCVSLRNRPKAAPEPPEPPEQARKGRSAPAAPPPAAPARSIFTICNPIYYISRRYTPILIINNKLFALFLARFKTKPYLCIV